MNRALIGRQPIFRSDRHHILGYELLFRDSDHNAASFSNADRATAEVLVNSSTEIGLDKVVGPHLAFINFGRSLLLGSLCEAIPHQRAVLEILENVLPDAELLQRLRQLRAKGYRIALDDFPCDEPINTALLPVADYVKLDLQANDWTRIEGAVAALKKYPLQLIAEKVETPEQFQLCKRIGFDFFQGYFFCRPQVLTSPRAPVNRLATIQLITKLNDPDIQFKKLETVICQDVSLSYKLLRYVNSAVVGLRREVESIGHAAMLVGHEKLKIWASLILFSGVQDKPPDLIITGLVRARMCEKIAETLGMNHRDRFFLVGLFSVLDAILDQPLTQIVPSLPLRTDITNALLHHEGQLGSALRAVIAYEQHDWMKATCGRLGEQAIREIYRETMESVLSIFDSLAEQQTA